MISKPQATLTRRDFLRLSSARCGTGGSPRRR
jgi:hypothetical protein